MKRILIIDGQYLFRLSLQTVLRELDMDCEIVEAESIGSALELLRAEIFDLVVLDIEIENHTGIRMIEFVSRISILASVIIFTSAHEHVHAERYLLVGAKGFIQKSAKREEVVGAMSAVLNGRHYVSNNVHKLLLNGRPVYNVREPRLSDREREVMQLILQGKLTKEIAGILQIQGNTVSTYKANIFRKMRVNNVLDLAKKVSVD